MPASDYVKHLRARIGRDLILLPGTAAVIRDERGRVLLQQRTDNGGWSLPGGAVDPGETPAQATVREVREETGLRVRPTKIIGVFGGTAYRGRYPNGDEVEFTSILFECAIEGGELRGQDGETSALRFFTREEMPRMTTHYPHELLFATPAEPYFAPHFEPFAEPR